MNMMEVIGGDFVKCTRCNSDFNDVLEKVEFAVPGNLDTIVIRNDLENPCCPDCMYEAFEATLDSL